MKVTPVLKTGLYLADITFGRSQPTISVRLAVKDWLFIVAETSSLAAKNEHHM